MLQGRQFFAWEVGPLVGAAYRTAESNYFAYLDYEQSPELDKWRRLFSEATGLRVEAKKRSSDDANAPREPPLYRESSPFWQAVDHLVSEMSDVSEIRALVSQLPIDAEAGKRNVNKLAIAGGLVAIGVGFWLWGKGKL